MRFHTLLRGASVVLAGLALAACNDEPDNPFDDWSAQVDTVTLFTVDDPGYQGLPSAYDIKQTRTQRIEDNNASGQWEFALTGGVDGPLTITPLGAFFGVDNNAGIATLEGEVFEDLDRAPSASDAYVTDVPIELELGVVYVVRARTSGNCLQFAKMEPLEIDEAENTFRFRVMVNPFCGDLDLIPPED